MKVAFQINANIKANEGNFSCVKESRVLLGETEPPLQDL